MITLKNPVISRIWRDFEGLSSFRAAIAAGIFVWLVSTFFFSPPLWMSLGGKGIKHSRVDDFVTLCKDPLSRDLAEPILAYRITAPVLAWSLGLRGVSGVIVLYAATLLTLSLIFHIVSQRSGRWLGLLVSLGVACAHTVIWANTKPGFVDPITHLTVVLSLLSGNPFWICLMTIFGTMNDERFLVGIPFILLWHVGICSFMDFMGRSWKIQAGILAALVFVCVIRHALTVGWIGPGIVIPEVYKGFYKNMQGQSIPCIGWSAFLIDCVMANRAMWALPILFLLTSFGKEARTTKVLYILAFVFAFAVAAVVADVGRSVGFAFPGLIIAAVWCHKQEPLFTERVCAFSVVACLILPSFHYWPGHILWDRPLLLSILRAETGFDVLSLFHHTPVPQ